MENVGVTRCLSENGSGSEPQNWPGLGRSLRSRVEIWANPISMEPLTSNCQGEHPLAKFKPVSGTEFRGCVACRSPKLMVVVVMMAFVVFELHRDGAAGFRNGATDVLELHRGVGDAELLLQHPVQPAQNDVAG